MKVIYPGIIKRIKRMLTGNYVEDGNTASQNIPAGKYVTWKNGLYKAKSAITTGDTLSSSNLEAVTDGGINALNSKIKHYDVTINVTNGLNITSIPIPDNGTPLSACVSASSGYTPSEVSNINYNIASNTSIACRFNCTFSGTVTFSVTVFY